MLACDDSDSNVKADAYEVDDVDSDDDDNDHVDWEDGDNDDSKNEINDPMHTPTKSDCKKNQIMMIKKTSIVSAFMNNH